MSLSAFYHTNSLVIMTSKYYHPYVIDAETEIQTSYTMCQRLQLASCRVRTLNPGHKASGLTAEHTASTH